MEVERLAKVGAELGLEGVDLQKFIQDERTRERDLRAQKRDELKEHEHHEKEILTMQIDLEKIKLETAKGNPGLAETLKSRAPAPRLPEFREGKDDMDAYLQRFERYAAAQGWQKPDWAINLSALLQGKGVSTYNRLASVDANNFDVLKLELLKTYQLSEEGFKDKFKSSKPEVTESAQQFLARIDDYLRRWVDLSHTEKNFDGLVDLLLKEQFVSACSKEMALFIKERHPKTAREMTEIATQYMEARGGWGSAASGKPNHKQGQQSSGKKTQVNSPNQSNTSNRNTSSNESPRKCFICDRVGHIAKNCYQKSKLKAAGLLDVDDDSQQSQVKHKGNKGTNSKQDSCTGCSCAHHELGNLCTVITKDYINSGTDDGYTTMDCCGSKVPVMSAACSTNCVRQMPVKQGVIDGKVVSVLRDSGCSTAVIRRSLISSSQLTGEYKTCVLIDGTVRRVPAAVVQVNTPYYIGQVTCLCMTNPVYDLILGNIEGVSDPSEPDRTWKIPEINHEKCKVHSYSQESPDVGSAVETRAQKVMKDKAVKELKVPKAMTEIVTAEKLQQAQETDTTLDKFRELSKSGEVKVTRNGGKSKFIVQKGILYREFQSPTVQFGEKFLQVVVPRPYRDQVMKLAHESILGGHQGTQKTTDKVLSNFFWPGLTTDISRFCQSCDRCQRTLPKGRVSKVPLGSMPLIDTPFQRIAIDLVGPIHPCSDRKNRYILTVVDYATRYPEAVALANIDTKSVAEALFNIYTRVGFPQEILSDHGSQFTSDLMHEISRLLSIKQITSSVYHPICNGLCERFNGTLKLMLRKMCEERPKDWDRYLNALLFAYRETPQSSTGFSPFDLLYGRRVRGPLCILKELWTGEIAEDETKSTYQYVLDLQQRLEETCDLARRELQKSQRKYKMYYDRKAKCRKFKIGDEVLLLLPTDSNKLLMHWKGPFTVVDKVGTMDYKVDLGRRVTTFHANLLKRYHRRPEDQPQGQVTAGLLELACASVIEDEDNSELDEGQSKFKSSENLLQIPPLEQKEFASDVDVCDKLSDEQQHEARRLIGNYQDVFTDIPGNTNLGYHDIKLTDLTPIRSKPYPIPHALREAVNEDVKVMISMGIVEPSESPYASPLVVVKKPDGSNRICSDMRKINQVTVFDAEPTPDQSEIFAKLANDNIFTKLDLSKGYWQVPLSEKAKPLTAFITHNGLYQFCRMPFGLVNSGASFSRIMRKLLQGLQGVDNYIDDILVHTTSWEEHMEKLRELLRRLRRANLTARPTKCCVGYEKVEFLGHIVGQGLLQPKANKLEAIQNASQPQTKTQLRSFLGLANYYRQFIPNFAAIAVPLTDKTKKGESNQIEWGESQEKAFRTLKSKLAQSPILHLPDISRPFILRTDASDDGVGAVLMQEFDGLKFPVAYASKKLLSAQRNYSVSEKESYAIVWAVQKFEPYLYGRKFQLETDHQPLLCMQRSKVANGRIMRWALSLQPYRFQMVAIKGKDNVGADYMSRSTYG